LERKAVLGIMLALLLIGMLTLACMTDLDATNSTIIVLPWDSLVEVTAVSEEAGATNELGLYSPDTIILFPNVELEIGKSVVIGPYPSSTELIFYIKTWWTGVKTINTLDDPEFFIVTQVENDVWKFECEDAFSVDKDYNDVVFDVRLIKIEIEATIDIDPDTLNLKSKGKWITAYIQLPEEYNPEDIDATTILLNDTIQPILDPKYDFVTNPSEYLVDHDDDGVIERMVKFDRAEVETLLSVGEATLTITGKVSETPFEGSDAIIVIGKMLTLIGPWSGVEMDAFMPVLQAFEEKTGIDVEYKIYRAEDLATLLPAEFAAGTTPGDVIFMSFPVMPWWITQQAQNGHILEVTDLIDESDFFTGVLDRVKVDNTLYGGPFTGSAKPGFWYRKSFFAANGLTPPNTWAEFNVLLENIASIPGVVNPIASGDAVGWPLSDVTEHFLITFEVLNSIET